MSRSGSFILAIASSTACSPTALSLPARASAFSSWARSFIAARSSALNPSDVLRVAVVRFAGFWVAFFALILPSCSWAPPFRQHKTSPVLFAGELAVVVVFVWIVSGWYRWLTYYGVGRLPWTR